MRMRVGKVTQIFPNTGKIKVLYEDEGNASLQLSMITMNQEYSMPTVGDRVLTMHMENGSSKGFVLGDSIVHIVQICSRLHLVENQLVESVAAVCGQQIVQLQGVA